MSKRINFLNEPKVTEHLVDSEFNQKRKDLVPEVENFIEGNDRFDGKEVEVTFSHSGISSLVSILDIEGKKLVLKVPLIPNVSRAEGAFLKAWEDVGVKVPHILEEGEIAGQPYMLMEHIDALTLSKTHSIDELIQNKHYVRMGQTLKGMHRARSIGYGNVINGLAEYENIHDWISGDTRIKEKVDYIREEKILSDSEHGSIETAYEILESRIGQDNNTVLCHNDFHIGNVFATEPLTVFDPLPAQNHPYMDVARSVILAVRMGLDNVHTQLLEGYFGDEQHDEQLLQAFLVLNGYMKLKYWNQTERKEDVAAVRNYLSGRKQYLEGA